MIEVMSNSSQSAVIKVIGVGGCGCNAVANMLESGIEGVEFIVANTDAQVLRDCKAKVVLQLGGDMTRGLGAGADPEVGRLAAEEDRDRIQEVILGSDMLFITAGMGGGTGTGAAPVIAKIAREMGILTVAVVTKPFNFEGKRNRLAEEGINELVKYVDSLITIPNQKLISVLGRNITVEDAFKAANNVLNGAVQGIAEVITREGMINVDFADVKTVMTEKGMAMMGSGSAKGENRAREAAEKAISSPFLEDVNVHGATGVLVNITSGRDLTLFEFEEVGKVISEFADEGAMIVFGTVYDENTDGALRVTVIATGLGNARQKQALEDAARAAALYQQQQQQQVYAASNEPTEILLDRGMKHPRVEARAEARIEPRVVATEPDNRYEGLKTPTVNRRNPEPKAVANTGFSRDAQDIEYLDIPSFLRRQAD